ncbi:glycosyltransferase family 2 protein, partial [Patescibacteria group bacterium]
VVKKYKSDLNLKVVIAKKRGTGFQRNLGALNAKYDNLVFFDADNKIPNDFLEKMVEFIKEKKADLITGMYNPLEASIYTHLCCLIQNFYIISHKRTSPVATGAFMYFSKEAFNSVEGFDETIVYGEDSDMVKRVVKKGYKFDVMRKPKTHFSFRRHYEDGRIKTTIKIIKGTYLMQRGQKFRLGGKIKYKFGHYKKRK